MASPVCLTVLDTVDGPIAAKVAEDIKKMEGCLAVFHGQKKEDQDISVLCTQWRPPSSVVQTYRSSPLVTTIVRPKKTLAFEGIPLRSKALVAPCTEVFTAYEVEKGFADNVERFMAKVEADMPEGCYGGAVGTETATGHEAATLLLGWTGVEAHVKAKSVEDGVIMKNIHELRTLRRSVDLFHVAFTEAKT